MRTTAAFRPASTPDPSTRRQQLRQQAKSQEALCLTLASQIEALNTEGVSDKVSKAAAKKYKLKATDLTKADELNKANTEFQGKCSSYPPRVAAAAPTARKDAAAAAKEAPKVAALPRPSLRFRRRSPLLRRWRPRRRRRPRAALLPSGRPQ